MQLVNPKLHKMYDELRMQLMSVEYYKNRLSEKCDMSKTCGFKYDEYWAKANHYHTMPLDDWYKWYGDHCGKCKYMCEICMYGED